MVTVARDDHETEFKHTRQVLEELGYEEAHETDCGHVQHLCSLVSRRAAFLASAGMKHTVTSDLIEARRTYKQPWVFSCHQYC